MKEKVKIEVKQHPSKDVYLIKLSVYPKTILEVDGLYAVTMLGSNEAVMNMTPQDYLTLSANRHTYGHGQTPIIDHPISNFNDVINRGKK